MSRVAKSISCKESEIKQLRSIVDNPKSDPRYAQKAQIILQLSSGRQITEVAKDLDVSKTTVLLWRNRFLEDGIDGLNDAPRSGRRGNSKEAPEVTISKTLSAMGPIEQESVLNSADDLSRVTGVSTRVIYKLARDGKIQLRPNRSRSWDVPADNGTTAKSMIIEGLYISSNADLLVVSVAPMSSVSLREADGIGQVPTHNRILAESIQRDLSDHDIQSLMDILFHAEKLNETGRSSSGSVDVQQFLQKLVEKKPAGSSAEYHAYLYARDDVGAGKLTIPGIYLEQLPTLKDFLTLIKNTFELLRRSSETNALEWQVQDRVKKLIDSMDQHSEPFIWTRNIRRTASKLSVQISYQDADGQDVTVSLTLDDPFDEEAGMNMGSVTDFRNSVGRMEKVIVDTCNRAAGESLKAITTLMLKKKRK